MRELEQLLHLGVLPSGWVCEQGLGQLATGSCPSRAGGHSRAFCRAMALAGLSCNHRALNAVVATVSKEAGLLYCCFACC